MKIWFPAATIANARRRQKVKYGDGYCCAKCGGTYWFFTTGKCKNWFAIPRIPIKKGGKSTDNCIIVCLDCYNKIGQDGTKVITYEELEFFNGSYEPKT